MSHNTMQCVRQMSTQEGSEEKAGRVCGGGGDAAQGGGELERVPVGTGAVEGGKGWERGAGSVADSQVSAPTEFNISSTEVDQLLEGQGDLL